MTVRIITSQFHKNIIGTISVIVVLFILEGQIFDLFGYYDTCYVDRFADPNSWSWRTQRFVSSIVTKLSGVSLAFFLFCLTFWSNSKAETAKYYFPMFHMNWNAFFACTYTILWYANTYCLIDALKDVVGDMTCGSGRSGANSISGHFSFYVFYFITLAHLGLSLISFEPPEASGSKSYLSKNSILSPNSIFEFKLFLLSGSFLLFCVSGVYTLLQTWTWGYHSLRQVYYGMFVGILSHILLSFTLKSMDGDFHEPEQPHTEKKEEKKDEKKVTNKKDFRVVLEEKVIGKFSVSELVNLLFNELRPFGILATFTIVSFLFVLVITGNLPFSIYEIVGIAFCWPVLIYTFIVALDGRFKIKKRKYLKTE